MTTIESVPPTAPALPQEAIVGRPRRASLRRFATPGIVIPAVVIGLWLVVVLFAPMLAPYGPTEQAGGRLEAPSVAHLFGTDALGRDVFSRVLLGAQLSLPVATLTIVLAVVVGGVVGAIAGYFGGWLDSILMRIGDITLAFPSILLAMAVAAALGPGLTNAFIAIVIVWWPIYARLVRGQILSIKEREHVLAARAIGMGRLKILRKHILPHAASPVVVSATMDLGMIIILVASLSFLGLGAAPPSAEWGAMITEGAANFYQWWIAAGPGLAMVSIVLAVNFLGDSLRDVLNVREAR